MKQMFQDMMSQLGSLSSVFAKCNDRSSGASSKEAGRIETDDVSGKEIGERSVEADMGRKPIFKVSEPTQTFLQLACPTTKLDDHG